MTKLPGPSLAIEFVINDKRWTAEHRAAIKRALDAAFAAECAECSDDVELSVLLTNDAEQQVLNHKWRAYDKSTNVLSFPQIAPFAEPIGLIGDISMAFETVNDEARQQAKAFGDHASHLAVHGFLHILGYDHLNDEEAEEMEQRERDILARIGIADPYAPESADS
ncbi:MAG: rRNA maturation RNase YbeY [Hyphomicrobiaceae bacterium]|nr:rRNA maturation RNase YbeY [Hyphomicrobiaceae bacterium]